MIVCGSCGSRNEDGESFCGECGAYLEWDGEKIQPEPVVAAATPEPVPESTESKGLVERVRAAVGPGSVHRGDPAGMADQPVSAEPAEEPVSTLAPPVPGSAPAPSSRAPTAQRPAAPVAKPRRRELPPDEHRIRPGEVVCAACGAGNVPTRKFCRRCGADLQDAPTTATDAWWRRLFRRRTAGGPLAGARNTVRSRRYAAQVWLAVILAALIAGGFVARGYVGGVVDVVRDRVEGQQPMNPTRMATSSAQPGHPAAMAHDGFVNRYWAPAATGDAKGQWVEARFARPFRLVTVRVTGGTANDQAAYLSQARPHTLRLTVLRAHRPAQVETVTLQDKPGPQDFGVAVSDVTSVRSSVTSAYGVRPGKRVAIAEIEFFGRP